MPVFFGNLPPNFAVLAGYFRPLAISFRAQKKNATGCTLDDCFDIKIPIELISKRYQNPPDRTRRAVHTPLATLILGSPQEPAEDSLDTVPGSAKSGLFLG